MNRSVESMVRFVNLTTSGLLAGSLGFGEAALVPGWEEEHSRDHRPLTRPQVGGYFNSIGPIALASSMTLAIGSRENGGVRRTLDVLSSLALAGVLAATIFVTVPINRRLDEQPPADYPSMDSEALQKNWGRAHTLRTALGVGAFMCAVLSNVARNESQGSRRK
jgi:hypothetical protein